MTTPHHPHSTCTNYAAGPDRLMCREHMAKLSRATKLALREAYAKGADIYLIIARAAALEAGVDVASEAVTDKRKAPGG